MCSRVTSLPKTPGPGQKGTPRAHRFHSVPAAGLHLPLGPCPGTHGLPPPQPPSPQPRTGSWRSLLPCGQAHPSTPPPGMVPCPQRLAPLPACSWHIADDTQSSPGFSRVSRNFPSSSSQWSRDTAPSCAGSSPLWLSSSASEAGELRQATMLGDSGSRMAALPRVEAAVTAMLPVRPRLTA